MVTIGVQTIDIFGATIAAERHRDISRADDRQVAAFFRPWWSGR